MMPPTASPELLIGSPLTRWRVGVVTWRYGVLVTDPPVGALRGQLVAAFVAEVFATGVLGFALGVGPGSPATPQACSPRRRADRHRALPLPRRRWGPGRLNADALGAQPRGDRGPRDPRPARPLQAKTRVKPTLRVREPVIHNGQAARLEGEIPGPRNDDIVVVLQVKQGDGWLAFRRYRTRGGGRFEADYLFRRTTQPTTYEFRAQVRESGGYPYLEGDSDPIALRVLPGQAAAMKGRRQGDRSAHS